jgi:cytochrome c biogenesis protein CcmG, thiol:disulfide interchange protein DsbE
MFFRASRRTALVAALTCLVLGCAASYPLPASAPSPLLVRSMPDFRRAALDGTTVDTAARRGRPLVIKFFAEYCAPCWRSLSELERLHRVRGDVAVVGVSEDETLASAFRMRARFGLSFPIVHDRDHGLSGRFRVTALPMTFVIDRQGIVRWVAETRDEELERAIAAVR